MISWIQKYFQHHFRSIFAVMLVLMIVSFVFTIGAGPGIGRADRRTIDRRVFGYNLASQDDQSRLFGDAGLSAQLQAGYPLEGNELQNYAFQRAASLSLADQMHVPTATKQEVADFIKTLRVFSGQDGQFDAQRYTTFRESLKTNPRMSEATVSRILSDDIRAGKIQKLLAGPGYVLSTDVKNQLEQADATWTLGIATVDYASFNPSIPTTEPIIAKFFDENSFRYDIPPRISVNYVEFSALALLPTVSVTDAEVRAFYDSNPARFPKPPTDSKVAPKTDANADYAAVRPGVETALKIERAHRLAAKAASDFSLALFERKAAPGTPEFDALIATQKTPVKSLAPFTREEGPAEFGGSPEIAAEAFKLGKDRVSSDAVNSPSGAVVLFWKELQPARKPLLPEVHQKVVADYIDGEKRKRFVELGRTVRASIENRVKAGDTFEKAVAAAASAGSVKIQAKTLPPFSLRQPPQDVDYAVFSSLERLSKGSLSDMIMAKEHGVLVYAVDKKLPDMNETSPLFQTSRGQLASTSARIGANAFLGEYVTDELKKSEPKVRE
jgi:peptidyl-prolyl cis-trans isomerase D